jgi:hypothetical protein
MELPDVFTSGSDTDDVTISKGPGNVASDGLVVDRAAVGTLEKNRF